MADTLIQQVTYDTLTSVTTTTETVLHELTKTDLISEAVMGPPGPPGPTGPTGPPGTGTSSPWQETVFTLSGDQTVFTLPMTPASATVSLFTNGLRELNASFTVVGNVITISGFVPGNGDTVTFTYQ